MTSTVSEEIVTEESSLFKELFTTAVLEQEREAAATYCCLFTLATYQSETLWFFTNSWILQVLYMYMKEGRW